MSNKSISIRDIAKDPENLNVGNGEEGQAMIDRSVAQVGWGRSMVMSADGVMLAGNHALETAQRRGEDPIVVESDGSRPIIVKRTDLKAGDKRAKMLGILDNRTQQTNLRFDMPKLAATVEELAIDPLDVGFTAEELKVSTWTGTGNAPGENDGDEAGAGGEQKDGATLTASFQVVAEVDSEESQRELYERLTAEGFQCRLLTL